MRRIELHTGDSTIAKILREEFTERGTDFVVVDDTGKLPKSADLVASCAATNTKDEWTAARLGCMVAILPEALPWIRNQLDAKRQLVIVGGDRGKG
jgi:hypothetical protein